MTRGSYAVTRQSGTALIMIWRVRTRRAGSSWGFARTTLAVISARMASVHRARNRPVPASRISRSRSDAGCKTLASYTTVGGVGSVLDAQIFSLGCEFVEYPLAFQFLATPVGEDVGEPDASTVPHTTEWDGPLLEESYEVGA